ncbi:hypothetical protein BJV77DRAFT_89405 [Russula vinacea]|nr:hypothetical protein BJV77DRAFT_89405 [Russula vinacea]
MGSTPCLQNHGDTSKDGHSGKSREQPQSRKTGGRGVRRNIPVILNDPVCCIIGLPVPEGQQSAAPTLFHSFPTMKFIRGLLTVVQTHRQTDGATCHRIKADYIAAQTKTWFSPSSEVCTSYGHSLKTTKQSAEGNMVTARPTRQKEKHQPRRAGKGGAQQRSRRRATLRLKRNLKNRFPS